MRDLGTEPSMEDILSSIKRIIAEEGEPQAPLSRRMGRPLSDETVADDDDDDTRTSRRMTPTTMIMLTLAMTRTKELMPKTNEDGDDDNDSPADLGSLRARPHECDDAIGDVENVMRRLRERRVRRGLAANLRLASGRFETFSECPVSRPLSGI